MKGFTQTFSTQKWPAAHAEYALPAIDKGVWMEKTSFGGKSTFFNPSWSKARIEYEVAAGFQKGRALNPTVRSFVESTPSGIPIQFHSDSIRTIFYPLGK
jgi:hypothetical protein